MVKEGGEEEGIHGDNIESLFFLYTAPEERKGDRKGTERGPRRPNGYRTTLALIPLQRG